MTTTEPDVLEVLPDGRTSRYTRRDETGDTNPDDLATVDSKVAAFRKEFPQGIIDATDIKQLDDKTWLVTARVWKHRASENGKPDSAGSALRTVNLDGHVSEAFALESAQSLAILRSLRFLAITATEGER
ncbi:hypothetical protein [Microbacterium jejuense]|uniref:hypothetical protein n=1 Tax=Microbacterium jejuense TaxID=1263637 RepID=UPI0031E89A4B